MVKIFLILKFMIKNLLPSIKGEVDKTILLLNYSHKNIGISYRKSYVYFQVHFKKYLIM